MSQSLRVMGKNVAEKVNEKIGQRMGKVETEKINKNIFEKVV